MLQGQKSKFYIDVKTPVKAGMKFGTKDYKIKKIGYDLVRIYFDNQDKDCTIGMERLKRILNY